MPAADGSPPPPRGRLAALVAAPVVASVVLALFWTLSGRLDWPQGDEPHYLIMSASVLRDADLELRNNYEHDAATNEIYGRVEPHAFLTESAWWPYHTPGLGILLVLPFALGGTLGARLALCLVGALVAWGTWRWLDGRLSSPTTAVATAGVVGSLPIVFGASQIYPDLAGGAVVMALVGWLWGRGRRRHAGWSLFWLATGLLCWLHAKYLAPAGVLAALGLWQARRDHHDTAAATGLPAAAASFPLVLAGPAALAWFHYRAFGTVLGGRTAEELASPVLRALEIGLGLHFDQAQGLFFQQPLFVPGLVAIGYLARRRHPLTVPWLVLYASLLVPNALQLARYGGGGPTGRFAWSAMWLWVVPIGVWLEAERATLERYVRPAMIGALAYQAALAVRWLPSPSTLAPVLSEQVWERNSLFPIALRYSLPSYYFWDFESYLWYLPNLIWLTAAGLLVATGVAWRAASAPAVLRRVWVGLVVTAALLLPVEPTADLASERERRHAQATLQSALSRLPRRFEAERMTPMSLRGTARTDPGASGGQARANHPSRSDHFIVFGPYISLDPGRYRAEVALRLAAPATVEQAARFEVTASRGRVIIGALDIGTGQLSSDGSYRTAAITFETVDPLVNVEFRVIANPEVDLLVDYVDCIPVLPVPELPVAEVITEPPTTAR